MHEYELTLIFYKFSVYQEGFLQNIRTMTERVDKMEASTLTGFMDQESSQLEVLVEQISELYKDKMEWKMGFWVHLAMAYPLIVPFLRGLYLTMNSWRTKRDRDGWK